MMKIYAFPTVDVMNDAVVNAILQTANVAIEQRDAFHLALAGGSTPKSVYELMAREPYHSVFPWNKMHFYFGDERCVPADHADSNYRMAREALLSKVPVPEGNVHPIVIDQDNNSASAQRYEDELKNHLPRNDTAAVLDLVLLGIGDDGHTASLFPGTPILNEKVKWVDAVYVEKFAAWRISMTYPLINAAANVFVIAAGSGKSDILNAVLAGEGKQSGGGQYPVQGIRPAGELIWYLDEAAATLLPPTILSKQ
jgi:6-phosphogluconolactonase